ncbi:hypothetical protein ACQPU1_04540 [Clostridium paraputrificum]|uniref:hypothetical protein n=1 Tax=Clostridium TaxID=1485 RepID=UPI003D34F470
MNFLYGAYGFDILSIFLLVLSSLLNFGRYTRVLGFFCMIIVLYRAFSKNIYKRSAELSRFTMFINKILSKFGKSLPNTLPRMNFDGIAQLGNQLKYKFNEKMKYKIVTCPNCKQKLRLPRGQKAIIVTCKRCRLEFKMRT